MTDTFDPAKARELACQPWPPIGRLPYEGEAGDKIAGLKGQLYAACDEVERLAGK